ncbi:MAG TPA: efflux RND transporter periplasmic adaptor subunit [Vicinamibacterales bacterium]|jgi:HlyD family secretion protein|nr:efflux RND transporter periplasmic adaptor subunit [Vicinamibacterales bacterium]
MKRSLIVLLIIAAIGAGAGAIYVRRGGPEIQVNTAPITRGDIIDTVGATGTLQAVTTVQVGSQVSGNISWLGADFNSIVKKGQVIARLDPSLIQAQLQQTTANLNQARANLTKAQSDLERSKVQLIDAQQKFARARELSAKSLLPQSDLDSAKIAVDTAQAMLASQQATVAQAQAAVSQSQASVNQSQVNLDHTIIAAPIDGIVTQRNVDVGQTVAASMQAPTLFIIAADLTKMQVNANIDESDVGRIRPAQHVTFRVDAYPTETFEGTVAQIRLQPVVVQNVTTYGTVIDVPNPQLKLKPGMTANVKVEIAKRTDVLRIPTAALRFRPTQEVFAALNQEVPPEVQFGGGGRGGRGSRGAQTPQGAQSSQGSPAATPSPAPSPAPNTNQSTPAPSAQQRPSMRFEGGPSIGSGQGNGGGASGEEGQGGRRGGRDFDPARMMERFKSMPPDEQKQFVARMKDRGVDTSTFEKEMKASAPAITLKSKYGASQSAQTIDALFAPLPVVETRGRAWLFMDHQLKPVNLRLGIADGTFSELLGTELQQNMEVVTGITGIGTTRTLPGQGGTGNPLMPGGRGGPGGFGGPGGGRGR